MKLMIKLREKISISFSIPVREFIFSQCIARYPGRNVIWQKTNQPRKYNINYKNYLYYKV